MGMLKLFFNNKFGTPSPMNRGWEDEVPSTLTKAFYEFLGLPQNADGWYEFQNQKDVVYKAHTTIEIPAAQQVAENKIKGLSKIPNQNTVAVIKMCADQTD